MSEIPRSGMSVEYCYRHPGVVTGVHCTRCGNPICPDCMIPAPVGYHCPDCVNAAKKEFKMGARRRVRAVKGLTVTNLLVIVIVAGYVVQTLDRAFLGWAALWPPAIASGEYWRLLTVILVHANLLHLGVNMLSLWNLGTFLEGAIGRARYLALFLVSGGFASAMSYAFGPVFVPAVGASGAIFGIFGGLIAYLYLRRHTAAGRAVLRQLMFWLALNVFISLQPGIDWRAHFGGLVSGAVTVFLIEQPTVRRNPGRTIAVYAAVAAAGIVMVAWRTARLKALGI